jgi:hypothetical protein
MDKDIIKYSDFIQPDDSIDNLITKLERVLTTFNTMSDEIKKRAGDTKGSISGLSSGVVENSEAFKEAASESNRLKKAYDDLKKAQSETAAQMAILKKAKLEQSQITKLEAKLSTSLEGSYNKLSAQYELNKLKLNAMSKAERAGTEAGRELEKQTLAIYQRMSKLQEATGKHTLSVGNYAKGMYGLNTSVNQISRELPTLAMNLNTFFLAISNNIPMLTDEVGKLRAANKAAAEEGKATIPVGRAIASAIFSWQTALSIGVALLTAYGKDLVQWIGKMIKGTSVITKQAAALKKLKEARKEAAKGASEEIAKLNLLYDAATKVTKGREDQVKAIKALKKEWPEYFKNLSDETIKAGEASEAYERLAKSILKVARSEAAKNKITENFEKILDYENQIQDQREKLEKYKKEMSAAQERGEEYFSPLARITDKWIEDSRKIKKINEEIKTLQLQNKKLLEDIDIGSLTGDKAGKDNALDILKEYTDSTIALIKNRSTREIEELRVKYKREISEYRKKLDTDEALTKEDKEIINKIIINKEKDLENKINEIKKEAEEDRIKLQEEEVSSAIAFIKNKSTREIEELRTKYSREISEYQTKLNTDETLTEEMRETINKIMVNKEKDLENKINEVKSKAAADRAKLRKKETERELSEKREIFDSRLERIEQEYDLELSEIDLLKTTEEEKTKLILQAEKDRLQKIIAMNEASGKFLSDIQIQIMKNTIEGVDKEISSLGEKKDFDLYSLMGIKLDDEKKEAISTSTQFAIDQVGALLEAKVEAAEKAVEIANREVDTAQNRLNMELEARNKGYASNVSLAEKELNMAKKNQEKALKEQKKAQKAQLALQTITQASDLVSASAKIWSQLGFPWAIPALAVMWGSFAAAKIKAAQLTKKEYAEGGLEFLDYGGSHSSGNDIHLGLTGDGKDRRAERGEALAIVKKSATRKYKNSLPDIIDSINKGIFEQKYGNFYGTDGMQVNIIQNNTNLHTLEKDVNDIKKQGERRYFMDNKGRIIETYKNLKRVYNVR